jgi:hypothetical protein
MRTYKQIVEIFEEATTAHIPTKTFAEGTIDYLDASSQNVKYPYMFLRPLSSPGLQDNTRILTFELYSLDVPKLSDQSPLQVKSNTELWLYDIIGYIRDGQYQQTLECDLLNIIPVNEAFNDRAFGWVATIQVSEFGVYNYCNFPQ